MSHPLQLEALQRQRDQLKARLVEMGDMRPGSLVERFRTGSYQSAHTMIGGMGPIRTAALRSSRKSPSCFLVAFAVRHQAQHFQFSGS